MNITVQKKVEETLEVKTPCYYRGITGLYFINESGQLISVNDRFISIWNQKDGRYYNEEIERIVRDGKPCTRDEFEKAFNKVMSEFGSATLGVDNATVMFISEAEAAVTLGEMAG